MDYITHYYKNRTIQLQQELEQLTETYNYRLNEARGLGNLIRRAFGFGGGAADDIVRAAPRPGIAAGAAVETTGLTAAQRQALALARANAIAAARAAAQAARQGVINALKDIPPSGWFAWFDSPGITQAEKDAFRLLFPNGAASGNLPGHGMVTLQRVNINGRVRILWWDDANDTWRWVDNNTNTGVGYIGPKGYVESAKNSLQASNMLDADIDPNLRNTEIATNTGSSTGSGLGSVAALYMSYDPRAVSRKINYITEKYYRY